MSDRNDFEIDFIEIEMICKKNVIITINIIYVCT